MKKKNIFFSERFHQLRFTYCFAFFRFPTGNKNKRSISAASIADGTTRYFQMTNFRFKGELNYWDESTKSWIEFRVPAHTQSIFANNLSFLMKTIFHFFLIAGSVSELQRLH